MVASSAIATASRSRRRGGAARRALQTTGRRCRRALSSGGGKSARRRHVLVARCARAARRGGRWPGPGDPDEQDLGVAPQRIENVQAGGHHVALEKNGKQIYDDFVEVEAGGEATVSAPAAAEPAPPREQAIAAVVQAPPRRSTPAIAVSGAV